MAALIFRLRNVPEDEADGVRALLDEHAIDWYETTAGNWGIAMPGIWAGRDDQISKARHLIERYQIERTASQRQLYEEQRRNGESPTLASRILQHPIRVLGIVLFCLFILYVSIHPFLQMVEYSSR